MRRAQSTSHPSSNNPFADPRARSRPASVAVRAPPRQGEEGILFSSNDAAPPPPAYSPVAPSSSAFSSPQLASPTQSNPYASPPARHSFPHQAASPQQPQRYSLVDQAGRQQQQQQQQQQAPAAARVQRRSSVEDPLAGLSRFDCVFLIDDSPSMDPLWDEARDALMGVVAKSVQYDRDGIDVHFLNSEESRQGCTQPADVANLFANVYPTGSTPTGMRLDDLLRPYVEQCEDAKAAKTALPKPMVLVVLTDGRADDEYLVKDVIVEMAGRLDDARLPPFQLGVQFLQIGNDPDAAEFLQQLDDNIKAEHNVRDIVDTRQFDGRMDSEMLMRILLGSVNRRVDSMANV